MIKFMIHMEQECFFSKNNNELTIEYKYVYTHTHTHTHTHIHTCMIGNYLCV